MGTESYCGELETATVVFSNLPCGCMSWIRMMGLMMYEMMSLSRKQPLATSRATKVTRFEWMPGSIRICRIQTHDRHMISMTVSKMSQFALVVDNYRAIGSNLG